jgi:mannose-6-phosphate isomerase-like protein (cupin superfamily)
MRPVRHHFGITAFGTNAWTAANEGDRLMPEHEEDEGIEELYVVLRGRARFEIDGDTVDAPEGTLVFVRPQTNRTAFAEEPGTTVLAIGSTVGQAYEVRGWEVWAEFHPAYEAGDYETVIDRGRETLEASGYPLPLYNLACCEALTGRKEDAIGHLRVAFEGRPGLRDLAKEDSDLDALRDEPAFRELVD